jgi:hypothetical protein
MRRAVGDHMADQFRCHKAGLMIQKSWPKSMVAILDLVVDVYI